MFFFSFTFPIKTLLYVAFFIYYYYYHKPVCNVKRSLALKPRWSVAVMEGLPDKRGEGRPLYPTPLESLNERWNFSLLVACCVFPSRSKTFDVVERERPAGLWKDDPLHHW